MTSPAHVCPFRMMIYFPCLVWERVCGAWGWYWRAAMLTADEAEAMAAELLRLAGELRQMEREEQERVTRADIGQVQKAA